MKKYSPYEFFYEKAHAKINIFLKIVGKTEVGGVGYHLINSRFLRVESLFDELILEGGSDEFCVIGACNIEEKQNTIYKAYLALLPHISKKHKDLLNKSKVKVIKRIPLGAGLGGGSSDAAAFLRLVNKAFELGLSKEVLMQIGAEVGSDVPFFISELSVANVSGRGEIVESCEEGGFGVRILNPSLHCSTKEVFSKFAKDFYTPQKAEQNLKENWLQKSNDEVLKNSPFVNNDLLEPLLALYPELESYAKEAFLSGSGSCFWQVESCKEK
ncbi:MAG: 4-(cytidine 5'-diphospho)-2-C-methyl-D-erythritol kinase [Helicobacter sp.]|nr:4-(cytidine 5'-diphospho)-2-C-methyl-D-erythritol kinase [Helicobacter sp.]